MLFLFRAVALLVCFHIDAGFVYRLGHWPFTSVRRVRFPYPVPILVPKCSWTHATLSLSKKGIVTPWDRQIIFHSSTAVVQLAVNQLVGGSIPSCGAILYPSIAQSGSASGLGPEGREFKSLYSDQILAFIDGVEKDKLSIIKGC